MWDPSLNRQGHKDWLGARMRQTAEEGVANDAIADLGEENLHVRQHGALAVQQAR